MVHGTSVLVGMRARLYAFCKQKGGYRRGPRPKSEMVQVGIRPELKREFEELKRPSKRSRQRLGEGLLASCTNEQRHQHPHPSLCNGT